MQKDYLYPSVGDRSSPKEWDEKGRPSILDRAGRRLQDILDGHFPTHIPAHVDDIIREQFPVRLPGELTRSPAP
jgi:trimethylamine--corrinoid protein Co-methyltransferase